MGKTFAHMTANQMKHDLRVRIARIANKKLIDELLEIRENNEAHLMRTFHLRKEGSKFKSA